MRVYKIYVIRQRNGGSEVLTDSRTITPSAAAAAAAWADLYGQDYDQTHLLLLTQDGAKLAVHRYGSKPGDEAYVAPGNPLTVKMGYTK